MDSAVRTFYDELAGDYHLLFADWHASRERQAAAIDRLIREALGPGRKRVLDCACGIGTQAIGLAQHGHLVHATDLSPAAVARAEREAENAGVSIALGVADVRSLAEQVPGTFDVVLAGDNALPHLLDEADLRLAVANMAAKLEPGGLFIAIIRDYDALVRERPRTEGPRVLDGPRVGELPSRSGTGQRTGGAMSCTSLSCSSVERPGQHAISRLRTGHCSEVNWRKPVTPRY